MNGPTESRRRHGLTAAVDYLVGYDVFISYSHRDGEYARKLKERLDASGISCFLDSDELATGSSLRASLKWELRRSGALVVVLTEQARQSPYVALEVEEFARKPRPIIPIVFHRQHHLLSWPAVQERDLIWVDEEGDQPSVETVTTIGKSLRITRRRALANRLKLGVSATIVMLLATAAVISAWYGARIAEERQTLWIVERKRKTGEKKQQQALEKFRIEQERAEAALEDVEMRKRAATLEMLAQRATAGNTAADLRMLLSVEAVRRAGSWKMPVPATVEHALRQAVLGVNGLPLLPPSLDSGKDEVKGVAITEDARWLVLGVGHERRGRILVFDLTRPLSGPVRRLTQPGDATARSPIDVGEIAVAADLGRIFAGRSSGILWNLAGEAKPHRLGGENVSGPARMSSDGRWLCRDRHLYDLRQGTDPVFEAESGMVMSRDGKWIAHAPSGASHSVVLRRVADVAHRSAVEARPVLAVVGERVVFESGDGGPGKGPDAQVVPIRVSHIPSSTELGRFSKTISCRLPRNWQAES